MKIKIAFFTFVLAVASTLTAFAQITSAPATVAIPQMNQQDKLNKMAKPTLEATSGNLHFSIWITTQEEHKKMMSEMSEGMDKDMNMKNMGMKHDTSFMKDKGMGNDMDMKDMGMKHDTSYMKDKRMDKNMDMNNMGMKKDSSMKNRGMWMDNETIEAMMAGTHHIMVLVKDTSNIQETKASSAKVEIVSPTNKNTSVELRNPMMNHFGIGLFLDEKGEYQLNVSVLAGSAIETIKLKYTVL